MAKPYFRKDTATWYVLQKRDKIKIGKSERAAKHLADKINLEEAEGRAGLHKPRQKNIRSFFEEITEYKRINGNLKDKTIVRYKEIINNFLNFLTLKFAAVTKLSQLDHTMFESYVRYRKGTPLNKNGLPIKKEQLVITPTPLGSIVEGYLRGI